MIQPEQIIYDKLSIIQRRLQTNQLFRALAFYGFWALFLDGALLFANRFFPPLIPIGLALSIPIVLAVVLAVSFSLLRKPALLAVARFVDNALNLKERLSTALDLIHRGVADAGPERSGGNDLAALQIRDAANVAQRIHPAHTIPYSFPSTLRFLPIPILAIGLSFLIPRAYDIPPPPTAAEQAAINDAAEALKQMGQGVNDDALARRIQETARALQNKRINVKEAQRRLSQLRDEVRERKNQTGENDAKQVNEAVAEISSTSKMLTGDDAEALAADLEKLAQRMEGLSQAQKAELEALLRKLAEQLAGNAAASRLKEQLNEIGTTALSPEMLEKIVRELLALDRRMKDFAQLERILEEIKASQKNIGLAGLNLERRTGGVANSGGGPGEESTTGEAQGTIASGDSTFEPKITTDEIETALQEGGGSVSASDVQTSQELRLTNAESGAPDSTDATQGTIESAVEPDYMKYRDVALNAKQAYAAAVQRENIPAQYRERVKAYLDEISKLSQRLNAE
jgi:hypothetical protein